ncbi:MAG: ATP-dependent DNA helicase PcrA, partial [Actinomycetota bacterium]|nr:ATP-dependent DNA helicase PcrA [Actinomycetota bacterium]
EGARRRVSSSSGTHRGRVVEAALRAPAAGRAGTSGAEKLGLRVGDDVVHAKWGEGVVLEILGGGDRAEAVVRFPDMGEKRLLLALAPLEKA